MNIPVIYADGNYDNIHRLVFCFGHSTERAPCSTGSLFWRLFISSDQENVAMDFVSVTVQYCLNDRMNADISFWVLSWTVAANVPSAAFPVDHSCQKHSIYLLQYDDLDTSDAVISWRRRCRLHAKVDAITVLRCFDGLADQQQECLDLGATSFSLLSTNKKHLLHT